VTLRAVLADDEPLARRKLARLLAQKFDIHLEGEASTGTEAVELIRRVKPDAAFLDIHMPGMDGFQVVEALGTLQVQVVFVTAYDEHAAKAFDVEATDYLLKPYTPERLDAALKRLRRACAAQSASQESRFWTRILVQGPRFATFILPSEIDWIEADRNYVVLHCGSKEHLIRSTLEAFAGRLDPDKVTEKVFARHLYVPELPDADLVWRTSGEQRLSNFLLWEAAYAELYFTDVLWPDFGRAELEAAVAAFGRRQRRFGLTDAQVAS